MRRLRGVWISLAPALAIAVVLGGTAGTSSVTTPPNDFGIYALTGGQRSFPHLAELGVSWVRLNYKQKGSPFDPDDPGELRADMLPLVDVIDRGYALWVSIHNFDVGRRDPASGAWLDPPNVLCDPAPATCRPCLDPVELTGLDEAGPVRGGYPYVDRARYKQHVQATVEVLAERIEAQPGKRARDWLVVQAGNEIWPCESLEGGDPDGGLAEGAFWHGTADQYVAQLRATSEAVKQVDPDVPVAIAGIPMNRPELDAIPEAAAAWMERLLGRSDPAQGGWWADWADVHLYCDPATVGERVDTIRALWGTDRPLAASEIGGPDPGNERICPDPGWTLPYTPAKHCDDLWERVHAALAPPGGAGVDRLLWTTLTNTGWTAFTTGRYSRMPLIDVEEREPIDLWTRKPAFFVYAALIAGASEPPSCPAAAPDAPRATGATRTATAEGRP